jgi:hypothetical protein
MHDPCTVAFTIKSPFARRMELTPGGASYRYRPTLITIWHVDPHEDSCGRAWDPATDEDRAFAKRLAKEEFDFWTGKYVEHARGGIPFSAHELIWWAWKLVAIRRRGARGPLTRGEEDYIQRLASNPHDNIRSTVAHAGTLEGLERFFLCVDRIYRTHHRPWYRHPRWHVHHWRIQVHAWDTFRRWAFSRCAHCGQGFEWGYSPVSHGWGSSDRPGWFQSEAGVYHHECSNIVIMNQIEHAKMRGAVANG